jgi:hypothetical protein
MGRTFGGSQQDAGTGIAVTPAGTVVVVGQTESTDFPTTDGAYQRELGGFAFFVTRFSPDGSAIISSTLFGGPNPNTGGRVALDAFGNAYVTGNARDSYLPWSTLDLQLSYRDFLAKFTPAGGLVWVIPIGDGGLRNSLAVDAAGEAYLAGASSGVYVTTADAVQSVLYCDSHYSNAVLIRINSASDKVSYGTYLGGTVWDYATAVAIDGQGNVYLAGETLSPDFPTTPGTFQPTRGGQEFVAKIDLKSDIRRFF